MACIGDSIVVHFTKVVLYCTAGVAWLLQQWAKYGPKNLLIKSMFFLGKKQEIALF